MKKTILIYTKTGDKGKTALIGGKRVPKYHLRVEAYGTIDDLNSHVGLLREYVKKKKDINFLLKIQQDLFIIQTQLSNDDEKNIKKLPALKSTDIIAIEKEIDNISSMLPTLKTFLIPGGSVSVAFCHIVRCVCRRAERIVVKLDKKKKVTNNILSYLNRLSDYFFVLARKISIAEGIKENELTISKLPVDVTQNKFLCEKSSKFQVPNSNPKESKSKRKKE